jgi:hypothetical protein
MTGGSTGTFVAIAIGRQARARIWKMSSRENKRSRGWERRKRKEKIAHHQKDRRVLLLALASTLAGYYTGTYDEGGGDFSKTESKEECSSHWMKACPAAPHIL